MSEAAQKRTPLYEEHVRRGARIIPFGGWLMPVQYTSIVDEHQAVRNRVGMFDISHMGQFIVSGPGSANWLNTMLTNNIDKLERGQGQYTFLLNEQAGVIDDLIAYRIGNDTFLLVVNASRTDDDFAWLDEHKESPSMDLTNRSAGFGGVAIQGPRVVDLFHAILGNNRELPPRNQMIDLELEGMPLSIARTGYTGEDGVEVFFRAPDAASFWNLVLAKGEA
ncbi:MAG: aminomethyltransferase, partial [Verrucomicrobiota bacterium]